MAITVCPVTPSFAAEIDDVDLSKPIEPSELSAIKDAFAKYVVLIFPDQHLSSDQHLDFARHFGPLETTIALFRRDSLLRVSPEFADVSNLNPHNDVWNKDPGSVINYTTESSPAWTAAQSVLAAVTTNPVTVSTAIVGINNAVAHQDLSLI